MITTSFAIQNKNNTSPSHTGKKPNKLLSLSHDDYSLFFFNIKYRIFARLLFVFRSYFSEGSLPSAPGLSSYDSSVHMTLTSPDSDLRGRRDEPDFLGEEMGSEGKRSKMD